MSVPNATAYVVSIGDVKADWSRAEIAFDVPKTDHPIVIYGMKGLRLPDLEYNSLSDCSSLFVRLMAGDVEAHQVRKSIFSLYDFLIKLSFTVFLLQFTLSCETMRKPQLLADILRFRVFVSRVTHVEVQLDFRLFENMCERPKKDVFEAFFIAAGTLVAYYCADVVNLLSVIKLIICKFSRC